MPDRVMSNAGRNVPCYFAGICCGTGVFFMGSAAVAGRNTACRLAEVQPPVGASREVAVAYCRLVCALLLQEQREENLR